MDNPGYIALSRQIALEHQMTVVANNIANQGTVGFQRQGLMFRDFLVADPSSQTEPQIAMVEDWATYRDTRPGALSPTGNPLDVALSGPGFLRVQGDDGEVYATRAGRLARDVAGRLVDRNGYPVLDAAGSPITIPDAPVAIAADGAISAGGQSVGRLGVVEYADPQALTPGPAGGLFLAEGEAAPAEQTRLAQGFVEESNVQPIVEMTQMIEISRQYQATLRLIEAEHERQRGAIQSLSQLA